MVIAGKAFKDKSTVSKIRNSTV